MSAQKNLELLHNLLPDKAARSIEEILSIVSLRKSATKKAGEFSFGMKQRLGLAQIFLTEPHFVVLDEPTVGLDPLGIEIIKNIILELSNAGIAVLFSSHQISDVFDICTRAIVMNEGEIVFDDNIANLLKKTYVIIVNRSIVEKQQFHQLGEDVKVENETIYTDDTSVLSKIMDLVTKNNYEIVDIRTENNYDILRKYLMTGGK
jgi:ABC-type multidrug transport system ATPase subunit